MILIKLENPQDLDTAKEMMLIACLDPNISKATRASYIRVMKQVTGHEVAPKKG